jgi:hypothetical protein
VSVAGHDDIATLLIDSLLSDNGIPSGKVIPVPGTPLPADPALIDKGVFTAAPIPEPFVSQGEQFGHASFNLSSISYAGNLAATPGSASGPAPAGT